MSKIPQVKTEAQARAVCGYLDLEIKTCSIHGGCEDALGLYRLGDLIWLGAEYYSDRWNLVKVVQSFLDKYFPSPKHPSLTHIQRAEIRAICEEES